MFDLFGSELPLALRFFISFIVVIGIIALFLALRTHSRVPIFILVAALSMVVIALLSASQNASSGDNMTTIGFIDGLVRIVLFLAAIGILGLLFLIIARFSTEFSMPETIMRALAAACGLLIYIGSKAFGLSIPDLAFQALSTSFPIAIGFVGLIVPSFVGVLIAWYVIRYLNSRDELKNIVGARILALMITFVFFLYCDTYLATFDPSRKGELTYLLPNIVFVLSVLLYAIFRYHPNTVRRGI